VNNLQPRLVVRGLVYNPGRDTIFHYFKTDTIGNLTEIAPSQLPLVHTAPIHGSVADVGNSALTDSIKEVRVTFTSIFRDPRTPNDSTLRTQRLTIHLMNAGLLHHVTCGQPPIGPTNVTAVVTPANGSTVLQTFVTIGWTSSIDEATGEKDVERYAIYRRLSSETDWGEPFASVPVVPGGAASYSFNDTNVQTGQSLVYAVSAQDCTPSSSPNVASSTVTIP
jgi:hypothetical protein